MLAHDRVSRAKQMMTPFVLRRRKDQVLKELPKKTERIEWCEMTEIQKTIYHQTMQRSRRVLLEESDEEDELAIAEAAGQKGRPKKKKQLKAQQQDLSSNVLMDLRKATAHPMLFRRLYDEETIKLMARACLQEPEFQESKYDLVVEDMLVNIGIYARQQYFFNPDETGHDGCRDPPLLPEIQVCSQIRPGRTEAYRGRKSDCSITLIGALYKRGTAGSHLLPSEPFGLLTLAVTHTPRSSPKCWTFSRLC
jgi:hypothetical protein